LLWEVAAVGLAVFWLPPARAHVAGPRLALELALPLLALAAIMGGMGRPWLGRLLREPRALRARLRESERRYRRLCRNVPGMIYRTRGDGTIEIVADPLGLSGHAPEEARGRRIAWLERVHPEDRELVRDDLHTLLRSPCSSTREYRVEGWDGRGRWVADSRSSYFDEQGRFQAIEGLITDITARKLAERAAADNARQWQQTFDCVDAIVLILDREGRIIRANRAAEETFRSRTLTGLRCRELLPELERSCPCRRQGREPLERAVHHELRLADGRWFEMSHLPIRGGAPDDHHAILLLRDISARKEAEAEKAMLLARLREKEKLEALGRLARGVAHEINNPINGVINFAQLILDHPGGSQAIGELAREIILQTERVAGVVRSLLVFSDLDPPGAAEASVARIAETIERTMGDVFRRDRIRFTIASSVGDMLVSCDARRMIQVLTILLTNARDALIDPKALARSPREVSLRIGELGDGEGDWVRFAVEDNGMGIPTSVLPRLFDPFFTTRNRSERSGLGLAVARALVESCQGRITVLSEVGKFSRFLVDIPRASGPEAGRQIHAD
jgi:PAS domain S-box-containing protein